MFDLNLCKIDFVFDRLQMDFKEDELMSIWNELDSTRKGDKQIHKYDEIDYLHRHNSATEVINLTHHDNFISNHKFIYYADDGRLCTALILDYIPFFNHDEIAKYLINSKSDKLRVYENEMYDFFLQESFLSDKNKAKPILDALKSFDMIDIINDDWNKIYGLIQKLIQVDLEN